MGIVASLMDRGVGAELSERRVLVWCEAARPRLSPFFALGGTACWGQ